MSKNWDLLSDRENGAIIMIRTVMSCRKFRARRQETLNSNRFDAFTHGFDDIPGNNRFSACLKTCYTGNPGCAVQLLGVMTLDCVKEANPSSLKI